MDLEERTLEDPYARHCEICGVELTQQEILAAREANGPFLCTVHAAEELPVPADDVEALDSDASAPGVSHPGQADL
jgi:hypothetical protein